MLVHSAADLMQRKTNLFCYQVKHFLRSKNYRQREKDSKFVLYYICSHNKQSVAKMLKYKCDAQEVKLMIALRDAHTASVPFNYVNLNILFNDIWIMYIEAPSESFAIPRMLKCQEVW